MNNTLIKKDRVLFWIDIELTHFCIAKFFHENYNCDMFAIIDINNKAKNFFYNQKLVHFEKVWYCRDYILKPRSHVDIEYLSTIEKKYNIDLWNIAYAERYFYNFNKYHKFSDNEILSILEQDCKFFESVLDEIKPNYIIMRSTDDHQTRLFHDLCKMKGVRILSLGPTRFGYRCMISESADLVDYPFEVDKNYSHPIKPFEELHLQTTNYSKQIHNFSSFYKVKFNAWQKLKTAFKFFISVYDGNYKNYFRNLGRTRFKIILHESAVILKKQYREFFIRRHSIHQINKNEQFIYFPLHFEPERALSIAAPFYTNQIETIIHIAKSLPVEYKLYVKEHPIQAITGWKKTSFYKSIIDLPNVRLLNTSLSSNEVLKNCSIVITISGTSALEAAFYQKPAIVFTDTIYSNLSWMYRLKNIEDLPVAIKTSLKKQVELSELNQFVSFIEKNSFVFDDLGIQTAIADQLLYGGFLNIDVPIEKMNSFIEQHRSMFETAALEYIKKITQINEHNAQLN